MSLTRPLLKASSQFLIGGHRPIDSIHRLLRGTQTRQMAHLVSDLWAFFCNLSHHLLSCSFQQRGDGTVQHGRDVLHAAGELIWVGLAPLRNELKRHQDLKQMWHKEACQGHPRVMHPCDQQISRNGGEPVWPCQRLREGLWCCWTHRLTDCRWNSAGSWVRVFPELACQ